MPRFIGAFWIAVVGVLAGCATIPGSVPQPSSPQWRIPAGFRIVGYFPSWSGQPEQIRYSALSHVVYAFALVDSDGAIRPVEAPDKLTDVVTRAHVAGTKVMVSLGGWNDGSTLALDQVSADPARIARLVLGVNGFLDAFSLDGVDLDWEFPRAETAQGYAAVVQALGTALHARGRELSLAVSAAAVNGQFVTDEAWGAADWLNVMAYDDGWGQPASVPHSSYHFARSSLDYWIGSRGVPPGKVVLGVPFYGRSLVNRKSRTYRSLLGEFPAAAKADVAGTFAYNGPDTLRAKVVNQARVRAGGVMIWQLNQDALGEDSLLSVIFDAVKEPIE